MEHVFLDHSDAVAEQGGVSLRRGYTTGSCAAAAAKAAAMMLRDGTVTDHVRLITPAGVGLLLEILDISRRDGAVSCAVRKYSGDDPDVTDGVLVYADVSCREAPGVLLDGGEGVGRVTKPGLDQPVGNAAINSVPRRMILEAVREVFGEDALKRRGVSVLIRIPEGEALAEKTFNPKLGIRGGISVLGTTGIVEPMSDEAIVETIRAEVRVRAAEGAPVLVMTPGSYGRAFFQRQYGFPLDYAAEISNFAAEAARIAGAEGIRKVLFVGHIGKLVKIAGGIENTHSRYGDHRMEILCRTAETVIRRECGEAGQELTDAGQEPPAQNEMEQLRAELMDCVSTDEAIRILKERGIADAVLREVTEQVRRHMQQWSGERTAVETVLFSNQYGELGKTDGAEQAMEEIRAFLASGEGKKER